MSYQNGRIPGSELMTVPGGARLVAPVAKIWLAVIAEVERLYGWTPAPTGALDGFRPLDGNYYAQHETFMRRYQRGYVQYAPGKVDARRYNGVLYYRKPGQAAAAVPGTSNHGWGCAIDVAGLGSNPARYSQFSAVAYRHGLSNVEGLSVGEKWHWTHPATVTQVKNGITFGGGTVNVPNLTAPDPIEEDELSAQAEADIAATKALVAELHRAVRGAPNSDSYLYDEVTRRVWSQQVSRVAGHPTTVLQDTVDGTTASMSAAAQIAALSSALRSLAAGTGLDAASITAAAEEGARRALADISATATVTIDTKG